MRLIHPTVSRRTVLAAATATATAALYGARAAAAFPTPPRLFGAAVQARQILVDKGFRDAVIRECGAITPELELKWDFIESESGEINLRPADQLVDFAMRFGKQVHGHTLVWHRGMPAWAVQALLEAPDWRLIERFFALVLPRYADAIGSWDVVNEPFAIGARADGLRETPMLKAFGPDYIRRSFEAAHRMAPRARLYLNEFGLLYSFPQSVAKRAAVLRLLEDLRAKDVPIHGLGVQAHLELARMDAFDAAGLAAFLDAIAALGLDIRISELDVTEADTTAPADVRDARAGQAVRTLLDVLDAFKGRRALSGITCWGLSDRYSWLPPQSESAGLNRGLPLDSDLREKPMFHVLEDFLRPANRGIAGA
ncbi:MAG: endo-1,4-beta-xylanase [Novosphingobium sp.]|nr:endo-1,4-beta-xylanase [Novosphingobium sp.]